MQRQQAAQQGDIHAAAMVLNRPEAVGVKVIRLRLAYTQVKMEVRMLRSQSLQVCLHQQLGTMPHAVKQPDHASRLLLQGPVQHA